MIIAVTHFTRMSPGFICVAGINQETGQHVRPTLRGRLSVHLSASRGGPFNMGEIIDLGPTQFAGSAPEVEDYRFDWRNARSLGTTSPAQFWDLLHSHSSESLGDIFGNALRPHLSSYVLDPGRGIASLGCLKPPGTPDLFINRHGRPALASAVRRSVAHAICR